MKAATLRQKQMTKMPVIPYPNSATKQEMVQKFVDIVLVGAIGAGLAACLLFFLATAK
jgi:hypothetical protein